jgi:hypothetical protein
MWAGIAILFVIVLVAISFAAGGAWLIIAVPLALVALAPLALGALRRRVSGGGDLRRELEHARPAVHDAAQAEDSVSPPQTP